MLGLASNIWGSNPQIMALPRSPCVLQCRATRAPRGAEPHAAEAESHSSECCPTDTTVQSELLPTWLGELALLHLIGHRQNYSPSWCESLPWAHKHLCTILELLENETSLDSHANFFSFLWLRQTAWQLQQLSSAYLKRPPWCSSLSGTDFPPVQLQHTKSTEAHSLCPAVERKVKRMLVCQWWPLSVCPPNNLSDKDFKEVTDRLTPISLEYCIIYYIFTAFMLNWGV